MNEEQMKGVEAVDPVQSSKLPLSHQEKAIAELRHTIEQLEARLNFVLIPQETAEARKNAEDFADHAISALHRQLLNNATAISKATIKIQEIMDRLEV